MQTVAIIGAILGMVAGLSFLTQRICRALVEKKLLQYTVYLCYRKILDAEDISWEDLKDVYASESERIVGFAGYLTPEEGHEIVARVSMMCEKDQPSDSKRSLLLNNLKRSLPQNWVIPVAGSGFYPGCGALLTLLGMIAALSLLNGFKAGTGQSDFWGIAGYMFLSLGIAVLINLPLAVYVLTKLLSTYRALANIEKTISIRKIAASQSL